MRRFLSLGAAALIVVAMAGCAPGHTSGTPTAAGEPTAPSATASPTPSAAAEDPHDPSTWIISAAGIGPVRLGQPVAAAIAAATAYVDVTDHNSCPNPRVTLLGKAGAPDVMLLDTDAGGKVVGVAVYGTGPKTAEGIGFGSPISDVTTTYPAAIAGTRGSSSVSNLWTVKGEPGWVSYEFMPAAATPTVIQVSVVDGGPPPNEWCN